MFRAMTGRVVGFDGAIVLAEAREWLNYNRICYVQRVSKSFVGIVDDASRMNKMEWRVNDYRMRLDSVPRQNFKINEWRIITRTRLTKRGH